ncbi:sensor histidine kinase [Paraburkholderia dipogonis]|uniref:Sensor histidine kinase n=1 Tax=Paraburkholderia dipogonis TaxID=1211383 RepID=A0A4Y8MK93_9BURK|nr:sensor histidine kinase [Paraburkholderia dipogonis]TFE37849.1 sensor histidine kinase [Paraburkholderia dipogonis]
MSEFVCAEAATTTKQHARNRRVKPFHRALESLDLVEEELDQLLRRGRRGPSRLHKTVFLVDRDGWVGYENRETPSDEARLTRTVAKDINPHLGDKECLPGCAEPRENEAVPIDRLHESYEMLRQLTMRRENAREDERKRIAREMHDELGQQLTALRMEISTLQILFGRDNPTLMEHIHKMLSIADRTLHVVRDVMTSLRPMVIDVGIVASLEWLTARCSRDAGIVCQLHAPQDGIELNETQAVALFRIVQEALTNVVRHANARKVFVELLQVDDYFTLKVRDDGRGFDPIEVRSNSFGLAGMRERVMMLSGEITVESARGSGTVIKIRVPVKQSAREAFTRAA